VDEILAASRTETGAGILPLQLFTNERNRVEKVRVNMGRPRLTRGEIPMTGDPDGQVVNAELKILDRTFHITAVPGNPHCVIFVDNAGEFPVENTVGDRASLFPTAPTWSSSRSSRPPRSASEPGSAAPANRLRHRLAASLPWLACSTATPNAACSITFWRRPEMEFAEDGHVYMTGPAVQVFGIPFAVGRFALAGCRLPKQ
jgi:diaminopimelate epimerase